MENAVGIAGAEDADAHGARRAERAAIAHQRAFGNLLDGEHLRLPGERRLHFEAAAAGLAAGGRDVAVEGVAGAHHVVPAFGAAVADGVGAGGVQSAAASMPPSRRRLAESVEVGELFVGLGGGVIGGRGEMRHQAFQTGVAAFAEAARISAALARVPRRPMPESIFRW